MNEITSLLIKFEDKIKNKYIFMNKWKGVTDENIFSQELNKIKLIDKFLLIIYSTFKITTNFPKTRILVTLYQWNKK